MIYWSLVIISILPLKHRTCVPIVVVMTLSSDFDRLLYFCQDFSFNEIVPYASDFFTHLSPFLVYFFLTGATSSELCLLPPRLFSGSWYCSIALACVFLYMCCACVGREAICLLVLLDNCLSPPLLVGLF